MFWSISRARNPKFHGFGVRFGWKVSKTCGTMTGGAWGEDGERATAPSGDRRVWASVARQRVRRVHAHPPTATGFAASGMDLNQPLVCEVVVGLGEIPLARYGTPGTPELTEALEPLVPAHDAILMANHGVVTYGSTLENAYMKMETVEHFAHIALVTHLLGRAQPLGEKEVEKLWAVRHRYNGGGKCAPARVSAANDDLGRETDPKETSGSRR